MKIGQPRLMRLLDQPKARWWSVVALAALFVLLPGPQRSLFSGAPLASRAMVPFFALVILAAFTALFPPARVSRARWIVVLLVLCAVKLALLPLHVDAGWRGTYWTSADWKIKTESLRRADFQTQRGIRPYRLDRAINFAGPTFNLTFINDVPPPTAVYLPATRDEHYPMRVIWNGYVASPIDARTTVTANGRVRISHAGRVLFDAINPAGASVSIPVDAQGLSSPIVVDYAKPASVKPAISLPFPVRVFPRPVTPAQISRSDTTAIAVTILGLLAFAGVFVAFTDAWPRLSVVALEHVWYWPMKLAVVAFFAVVILSGIYRSIPARGVTVELGLHDDPVIYEAQAREIIRNGPMMVDARGHGQPYYFYPFYSYALALAHLLMGEDYSNVQMFNYICIASIAFFVWALLKNYVSAGTGIVILVLTGLYANAYLMNYAHTAFTDNLYVPMVLATITASALALTTYKPWHLWLTGALAALAAATRPSFLIYVPCMGLALLFRREIGSLAERVRKAMQFGFGFAVGVAPFTIRNWIVSKRFVLLVSSFIMLPYFLYPTEGPRPQLMIDVPGDPNGRAPTLIESLGQVVDAWTTYPLRTLWVELRKLIFTFGYTWVGPGQNRTKFLWIYPILFMAAVLLRRVPRALRDAMLIFATSHIIAMILAAPWTYGYKTILPLHLAFLIGGVAFLLPRWGEAREVIPSKIEARRIAGKPVISVVLPTYNEKDSIRQSIRDFFATGVVDELLVINNNAVAGTSEEVAGTGAREIFERRQGYGAAIRRGLAEARGDYIVVCEPDGTFLARDIHKMLAYAQDFDVVYGSRTSQQLVWRGANMGLFLRWGNWFVAKFLEFLYNATSLTDVGCTFRVIRRDVAHALLDQFRIDGNQFGPEMMILSLRAGYRVIQVPINYLPRIGESSVTGDPLKAFVLGLQMIWLITSRRFEHLFTVPPSESAPASAAETRHGEV